MATIYRWTIYTDSVQEHIVGACSASGKLETAYNTRTHQTAALEEFRKILVKHVPDGQFARAWLEERTPGGNSIAIVRYELGEVRSRDIGTGRATAGVWRKVKNPSCPLMPDSIEVK